MKTAILAILLFVFPTAAFADVAFQFATVNVRTPDDPRVSGFRMSVLHGRNESVNGMDMGILSLSETGNLRGFSAIFGVGKLTGDLNGCATGLINLHTGRDSGVNAAFVNRVRTLKSGANLGFVNIADEYTMTDVGMLNLSDSSTVQLGFLNVTQRLDAVQIGFLNVAENGFLPVFPIFNFPVSSRGSGAR